MKRMLAMILAMVMVLGLLVGCGGAEESKAPESQAPASTAPEKAPESTAPEAATWDAGTVNVYVPAAAGSAVDLLCRVQTEYLNGVTGNNFVVINDETGNGAVAYETVRHADPDGATMLFTQNIFIQYYGNVYNEYPFDVLDVVAAGGEASSGYAIAIAAGRPYATWDEMVAYAKENPGKVVCGIQNGGMAHLMSALMAQQAGIDVKMVESGGSGEKITNMMGGTVDFAMVGAAQAVPYEESGDLIIAGHTVKERPEQFAEWPTTVEMGYPDVQVLTYSAWYVPKNMDEGLKQAINDAFKGIGEDQAVIDAEYELGYYPAYKTIEETEEILLSYAESLKAGYELAGVSMEGKK